jgi:epoxyqueuosine reductase
MGKGWPRHDKPQARIFDKAAELGFCAWGIARADSAAGGGRTAQEWIAAGHHGEMGWMEAGRAARQSRRALARSEVGDCAGDELCAATDPLALADAKDRGRISVYAQGADYHKVVKKALKAMGRWLADEAGASSRSSSTPRR